MPVPSTTTEYSSPVATAGARRQPRQSRSREGWQRVIEATGQLVVERGPAQVTTTLIAERAGVSVAWIYQYFESREQIFDVIVLDAVQRVFELTQRAILAEPAEDWRGLVRAGLRANAQFYAREPAFVRLYASTFRSTRMLQANQLHDAAQARWLYRHLLRQGMVRRGRAAQKAFELAVALSDGGLQLAFAKQRRGDRDVIGQLETALIAVLEPYISEPVSADPSSGAPSA
jgi:AcrR family transcriptional regulator